MKKIHLLLVCLLSLPLFGGAQQLTFSNQYLINKYSLSPAYAGFTQNTEAFAGYRQQWIGVQGAPEKRFASINGRQFENMGLGLSLTNDKTGIFNQLYGALSYAYHLKIDDMQGVSFGLAAGFYNNRIDISTLQTGGGQTDPMALNYQDFHGTTFDMNFGVMYHYDGFNIGVAMPRLLNNTLQYEKDKNDLKYTLSRHFLAHASFFYKINDDIAIEPSVVVQTTANSELDFSAGAMVSFRKWVWLAANYRKGNILAFSVGGAVGNRVVAHYTYEYCGEGMHSLSSGTHEFSIGYVLKYSQERNPPPTIFRPSAEAQKQEEQNRCCLENRALVKALEKRIDELQQKLDDCCKNKPQGAAPDSTRIKELLQKIRILEVEIEDLKASKFGDVEYEKPFVLKNITFATNSHELKASSFGELNKLVAEMNDKPQSTIKVVGFTDNVGDVVYNLRLSKKRARAVKDYLVSQGIDPGRIVTDGKGMADPIAPNDTNAGRAQNRRIEVSFNKK